MVHTAPRSSFNIVGQDLSLLVEPVEATWSSGLWRSLVAHLTGGQGVAGSNPVSPTV